MANETSISIRKRIKAPIENVFAAWTDPKWLKKWWGPDKGPVLTADVDARVGGSYDITFQIEDGTSFRTNGDYLEVVENSRLVFTLIWDGEVDQASQITVTLTEDGDHTVMLFVQEQIANKDAADSQQEGWQEAFEKLQKAFEER